MTRHVLRLVLRAAAGACIAHHATIAHAQPLVLSTGTAPPYAMADNSGFLDLLVVETFRRVGREATVRLHVNSERALLNANNGVDDGVVMRIAGLEKDYPNLRMIPERIIVNDFVAYTLKPGLRRIDIQSLASYSVGYITGWKIFDRIVKDRQHVTTVRDADQLFELLHLGRAEIALYERWQGLWQVRRMGSKIVLLEPPLARVDMFMYLHAKHAALLDPVTAALRAMKRDGAYRRIYDATLTPLIGRGALAQ